MTAISKSFPGVRALDEVGFDLRHGEVHALVGENGAGKSTLMKILTGVYAPDSGTIVLDGAPVAMATPSDAQRHRISIVHQDPMLFPALTVAENVFANRMPTHHLPTLVDKRAMARRTDALLHPFGVHIDHDQEVRHLSAGQRQVVAIAKALAINAAVVIFDEPTAVLTEREAAILFGVIRRLRADGLGIVYISHRIPEIFEISDRISVLRDGRNVATFETASATPQKIVNAMVGRELSDLYGTPDGAIGEVVLEVRDLTRVGVFHGVSFTVRRGEIVGFSGLVGSGRTEVALALFGYQPADSGEILVDGTPVWPRSPGEAMRLGLAYVSEDRRDKGLFTSLSVGENVSVTQLARLARWGRMDGRAQRELADRMIRSLQIKTRGPAQRLRDLSGGNQQKVSLAKWLARDPLVLIVDEPTSGVDVGAKAEIYRILRTLASQGNAIVAISSDLPEVIGLSDRVVVMHEGRVAGELARDEATEQRVMTYASGRADAA